MQHAPKKNSVLSSVFYSKGVKPIEIHRQMKVKFGDACLILQQAYEWTRKFMNGINSPRPGQTHRVVTPEATAAVAIVKENRRVTVKEIAAHLDMSHGSAQHIVHDVLQFIYTFIYLRFSFDSTSYIYRQVCLIEGRR